MKIIKLLVIASVLLLSQACKKETNELESNKSSFEEYTTCSFSPYQVGKYSVYQDTSGNNDTLVFNSLETIDNAAWIKGVWSNSGDINYLRCNGTYIFSRDYQADIDTYTIIRIAKINGAINDKWVDEINVLGSTLKVTHTITGINLTHTVPSSTFNDVMSIDVNLSIITDGQEFPQESYTVFYSEQLGLIDDESNMLASHNY